MLRRQADRILINNIDPAQIANVVVNTSATILPWGDVTVALVNASHKSCTTACVPRAVTVEVLIPTTCECPYEWCLQVTCLPDLYDYETHTTFPSPKVYCYQDPNGATPTAAAVCAAITAQINADPFACVTASCGVNTITLTGICDYDYNKAAVGFTTGNFDVFATSANIVETVPFVTAVLDSNYMNRLFPIPWGLQGAQPDLPLQGVSYCEYHFRIMLPAAEQDLDGASHWNDYEKDVYFYVRSLDANFGAFDGPIAGLIPIANGGTCAIC